MSEISSASHRPFDNTDLLTLPIQPAVVKELLAAFDDTNVTLQELARLIGYDAVMSARILAVANSTAYGNRAPRSSNLMQTLAVLAPQTIRMVAATTAIHQSCYHWHDIPAAVLERYWRHSLICADLARRLAGMMGYPEIEEAYLGGLLHDIGKLMIGVRHAKALTALHEIQTLAILAHTLSEVPELEQRLFGVDHCELGATLVETWELNSFLADAIRFHHLGAEELRGAHPLSCLLHVANTLSQADEPREPLLASAHRLLGLSPALVRQARAETEREVAQRMTRLGIALSVMTDERAAEPPSAITAIASASQKSFPSHETRVEMSDADRNEPASSKIDTAQTRLGRTVHELAILNEARGELCGADDEPALLEAITRCATILFDLNEVHIFLHEPETGTLRVRESGKLLREIVIDPAGTPNTVTRTFKERQISHSLNAEIANAGIVDRQLSRLWRTDGVLGLPLDAANQPLGVLGAGIARAQLPRLLARTRLLGLFAGMAADELDELRRREARRRRAREDRELIEQQHLRAVLHEVSNPLTIARNYLHLLAIKLGEQTAQEELRTLREETERMGRILLGLVEVGGDGEGSEESGVNLNKTIRDLARVLDDALCRPRGIRLNLNLADGLSPLARGRDAIRQVFLNLVRNAAEALGSGGTITVTTQDQINLQGCQYVEMAVADDGPGLSSELRAKIFQPVASTKGSGHAGLGLSIVKDLATGLGGYVSCRPNTGGGAVFLVLLPQT